ncbi:hypothetical protein EPUL_002223 [Erysiphe pulchra]|uniref:GTP-binding protein 8 n=1 Tax=Erysiphe pulchra TaxID=225359 RepID=A0A2S4PV51_9PEZI|nr:hypothetical protein EPUL_002223 [Erysiphe pulchra]
MKFSRRKSITPTIFPHRLSSQVRTITSKPYQDKRKSSYPSLSYHWGINAPSSVQLMKAAEFFQRSNSKFLWSSENFKDMPFGDEFGERPEVCFLGRSNVGKSSLLNTLLCQRLAFTSSKPGRTKLMSAFAVDSTKAIDQKKDKLIFLDVPGYGKGGRADIGFQVIKYLNQRRQLKRVFLLVDTEHGMKNSDKQMLNLCKQINVPFQVLLSKVDKVIPSTITEETSKLGRLGEIIDQVKDSIGSESIENGLAFGEIIPFSSTKWMFGRRLGINEVRHAVLRAVGFEYQETRHRLNPEDIITYDQLFPSESHDDG